MKKIVILLLAIMAMGCHCSASEETSFTGTILDVQQGGILVRPNSSSAEYADSNQIYVLLDGIEEADGFLEEVEEEDTVLVTYDGMIMETYPAQVIAMDLMLLERSGIAEEIMELISTEGFRTEFSVSEGTALETDYQSDYHEMLAILPSAEEDDPEGDPEEETDYLATLGWVTIYHYADEERAETASKGFNPGDPSEYTVNGETVMIDFAAPARLYLKEDCIILYGGYNETVMALIDGKYGEPFAFNLF